MTHDRIMGSVGGIMEVSHEEWSYRNAIPDHVNDSDRMRHSKYPIFSKTESWFSSIIHLSSYDPKLSSFFLAFYLSLGIFPWSWGISKANLQ